MIKKEQNILKCRGKYLRQGEQLMQNPYVRDCLLMFEEQKTCLAVAYKAITGMRNEVFLTQRDNSMFIY